MAAMFACGALRASSKTNGAWQWTRNDERIATVGYSSMLGDSSGELCLNYTWTYRDEQKQVSYSIRLSSRPLPFGGRYWYMHCPGSGRRARKLYKYACLEKFLHRTSIHPLPTYSSQRVSGSDRINVQRQRIRRQLKDDLWNEIEELEKPKWMRWRTFEQYLARDAELDERDNFYLYKTLTRLVAKSES